MIKVAPSILAADFANMGRDVEKLEGWGADIVHIDIMDGSFVPNISFGHAMVEAIRPYTKLPFDVHLMIENPTAHIDAFAKAGANFITIHVEAERHTHRALSAIKDLGVKPGIVLNPGTPLCAVEPILHLCDMVLFMSVNPGFGGQKFIPEVVPKIEALASWAKENNPDLLIEVDGGINLETAKIVAKAGANTLVAGSAVFNAQNPKDFIAQMKG